MAMLLASRCAATSARFMRRQLVSGVAENALGRGIGVEQRALLSGAAAASSDTSGPKKKKYLNDPSLRVRIVPMFNDNYGALCDAWRTDRVATRCHGLIRSRLSD